MLKVWKVGLTPTDGPNNNNSPTSRKPMIINTRTNLSSSFNKSLHLIETIPEDPEDMWRTRRELRREGPQK